MVLVMVRRFVICEKWSNEKGYSFPKTIFSEEKWNHDGGAFSRPFISAMKI